MAIYDANAENFQELQSKGDTIVLFHAPWCGPCKLIKPQLIEIEENNPGLNLVRVDIETERDLAIDLGVRGIPTMMLLRNGNLISQKGGFMTREMLTDWIFSSLELGGK